MTAKKHIHRLRGAVLALAVAGLCVSAATSAAEAPAATMIKARAQLLNAEIKNRQGEDLGEIEDLVLDQDGRIQYVVISHGGFLDIGDKVVAVPWSAARVAIGEDDHVIMDLTRAELAEAPNFEKDKWPDMSSEAWTQKVDTFTDSYVAHHEVKAPNSGVSLEQLDTNRDGHLSVQEAQAQAQLGARFEQLDRNQDGKLSQWEFNAFEQPGGIAADSRTSPSEQARAELTPKERQQRDEIAQSSQQENVTADAAKSSESSKGGGNTGKSAGETSPRKSEPRQTAQQGEGPANKQFSQLDADGNGRLSRDEAKASESLAAKFSDADRNHDGNIDASEFSAFESAGAEGAHEQEPQKPSEPGRSAPQ